MRSPVPLLIVSLTLAPAPLLFGAACGDEDLGVADSATATSQGDSSAVADSQQALVDSTTSPGDSAATDSTVLDSAAGDADGAAGEDATTDSGPPDTGSDDTATAVDTSADTSTPPPPEVRFAVMGDTGEGSERQRRVAIALRDHCARVGCDFVVLLGDNIYDAGVESVLDTQWQSKFEVPYADVDLPFYAVLGNHDNGGFLTQWLGDTFGGAGAEFERGDHEVAYSTVSNKWRMPARHYDFVAGPGHFFALDTNDMIWSYGNDGAEERTQFQVDTIPGMIDQAPETWRIAFGHHPYYSNGRHGDAGAYEGLEEGIGDLLAALPFVGDLADVVLGTGVKESLDAIVCGRVDLYFAGHDHNRQWFPPDEGDCPGTTFVVSGAGAKLTEFKRDHVTLFQNDQKAGFFWVHLKGNQIAVEAIDEDGASNWTHQGFK